jgi:hypothetical protein
MTNPKEKTKPGVPTRTPQKKTTSSGMFDNLRPLPHPIEEILGFTHPAQPSPTQPNLAQPNLTQPSPTQLGPTQPSPTQPKSQPGQPTGIAPTRDFNKRANSIDRDAMPKGHFPGTSYKLYNALYQRTRGAVVPIRTIQATKRELMDWSNIKSKNTIAINLQILLANGWIRRSLEVGDHGGSIYEIFTPEEAFDPTQPNPTQVDPSQPVPTQKLGLDPTQQSGWVGLGKVTENKDTSAVPKTSFKTNTEKFDDEAFAAHVALLKQATKEITGKEPSATEIERWREVAEVLVTELKIAAGRTSVSSVPAFLAEHLRRRLFKKDQKQLATEAAEASSAPPTPKVNASQCPDCFGTGMWYPEGYDKGVARCRHEKLTQPEGEGNQQPS